MDRVFDYIKTLGIIAATGLSIIKLTLKLSRFLRFKKRFKKVNHN